ncbi:hypothetical protein GPECTOR_20g532 [Gonium pectorale]|uniref:BTB domain-containing protein n=1 Tax=Gonium pectorale TaxID=33097 RepID=A0A150GIZ7_GONPE|nr:hypothetical protein GPECTOR_20g532 [Gonium pectorale]|eukprot:KXZ49675.1 hypothetical protein GPECTOR_20g532 [Gonium pectorale]
MAWQRHTLVTCVAARGVVALPQQTLLFTDDGLYQLDEHGQQPPTLGAAIPLKDPGGAPCALKRPRCPVYEPVTDCVYFVEGRFEEYALMRLDASNVVSRVPGGGGSGGSGPQPEACPFQGKIHAMAADGAGRLYAATEGNIYKISGLSSPGRGAPVLAAVSALHGAAPSGEQWWGLTFNPVTRTLIAATPYELYEVPIPTTTTTTTPTTNTAAGGGGGGGGPQPVARMLAGDATSRSRFKDGLGTEARFGAVEAIVASGDGHTYIVDESRLRELTRPSGHVHTLDGSLPNSDVICCYPPAITPSGWVAVGVYNVPGLAVYGPGFAPTAYAKRGLAAAPTDALVRCLTATACPPPSAGSGGGTGGGDCGRGCSANAVLTVRVFDRAFVVHRALLEDRCGYFKGLLASEGFAESAADEVALPDADPDVFGRLLAYMYSGSLDVPTEQLKATAELADRLLMPAVCEQLKPRLLAACTPATVVDDLLWADRHNLADLIPELKDKFVWNIKAAIAAAPEQLHELTSRSPTLAAEVIRTMARELSRP